MHLTVLGSGTAIPHPQRNAAGYLLRCGGSTVLLEAGSGTTRQLARAGMRVSQITQIWISHLHLDHCADLAAFLFACKSMGEGVRAPLKLIGPPGFREHMERLQFAHSRALSGLKFPIEVHEIYDGAMHFEGGLLRARPVAHSAHTVGFRIEENTSGASLTYTADSEECDALVELARHTGTLLAECSCLDSQCLPGHLSPARVARLAAAAQPGKVLLTHLYPEWDGRDPAGEVRALWPGAVEAVEDLKTYGVGAPM